MKRIIFIALLLITTISCAQYKKPTAIVADSIKSGTLADARLSSNVPLLDALTNFFTGDTGSKTHLLKDTSINEPELLFEDLTGSASVSYSDFNGVNTIKIKDNLSATKFSLKLDTGTFVSTGIESSKVYSGFDYQTPALTHTLANTDQYINNTFGNDLVVTIPTGLNKQVWEFANTGNKVTFTLASGVTMDVVENGQTSVLEIASNRSGKVIQTATDTYLLIKY